MLHSIKLCLFQQEDMFDDVVDLHYGGVETVVELVGGQKKILTKAVKFERISYISAIYTLYRQESESYTIPTQES